MSNVPPSIPPSGSSEGDQPTIPPSHNQVQGQSNNPFEVPQANSQQKHHTDEQGDATGGLIPYKNPPALIGYYMGYLGFLPILGIPFAIAAIVLGFIGLRKNKKNPIVRGKGHAIFAVIAGFIGLLCIGGLEAALIVAMIAGS